MCCRFDTIPACDGRTDRQTNGQTDGIAIASTALAMRALRRAVKTLKRPKNTKKPYSGQLDIRRDHPRRRIVIKFCTRVVFGEGTSKFHVSSKSVKWVVQICLLSLHSPLAYSTACATVQAVIYAPMHHSPLMFSLIKRHYLLLC